MIGICQPNEFACDGLCVSFQYICDGVSDCVINGTSLDETILLCGGKLTLCKSPIPYKWLFSRVVYFTNEL